MEEEAYFPSGPAVLLTQSSEQSLLVSEKPALMEMEADGNGRVKRCLLVSVNLHMGDRRNVQCSAKWSCSSCPETSGESWTLLLPRKPMMILLN